MEKGEIAREEQFLLFPQWYFLTNTFQVYEVFHHQRLSSLLKCILAQTQSINFAYDNSNVTSFEFGCDVVENIMRKGENAGY